MTDTLKKITVLIPCFNEENAIGTVIDELPIAQMRSNGFVMEVLVINNNSTDRTGEIAEAHGAQVIFEPKKGKGNAIRTGFYSISDDTDFVVMLDGDNTYRPEEMLRLIELLNSGFCSVVIGSRLFGKMSDGSMHQFNKIGNYFYSFMVRQLYQINITDVLTGYYAWTREAVVNLRPHLVSGGFTIEMEMMTKMARLGEEIYSVPISYDARIGKSNLKPIRDGSRILAMLLRNLIWQPNQAPINFSFKRKTKISVNS